MKEIALKGGPPPGVVKLELNKFHISLVLAAQLTYEFNFIGTVGQLVKYIMNYFSSVIR